MTTPHEDLPTLIVSSDADWTKELATQLAHCGFRADVAISCGAAVIAVRAKRYRSVLLVDKVGNISCLECLARLRQATPRSWIIFISLSEPSDVQETIVQGGGDILLTAPFSMHDLTSRLAALATRERSS